MKDEDPVETLPLKEDIYSEEGIYGLLDADELSVAEAGFMQGYRLS